MAIPVGLAGFLTARQQGQQQDESDLKQAGMLQALQQHVDAQQQMLQLRSLMAQTGGDVDKAMVAALQTGNIQAAHALAPLVESKRKGEESNALSGLDMTNPDALRRVGLALKKPEFITHAERIDSQVAKDAELAALRGSPAKTIQPDVQETQQAADQGAPAPQPASVPAAPGVFDALTKSEIPQIAQAATNYQAQMQSASAKALPPATWMNLAKGLQDREATFMEQRNRSQERLAASAGPGGVGSKMYQDPQTGQKYLMNRGGNAFELDEQGNWKATNPNNLPKTLTPVGNIGTAGARENVFTQRLIQAGNQASKDLENVVKLPLTASRGPFGAFGAVSSPSFMDAGKVVLGNAMTSQEQQTYNAMATGFQRTLAAIESAGLMPSGSLTHQMDNVLFKPGDTNLTKLHKLAQTRQIVESGMEVVLSNPRISDDEKAKVKDIVGRLEKAVPFTHSDLIKLGQQQATNPDATLRGVLKSDSGGSEWLDKAIKANPGMSRDEVISEGKKRGKLPQDFK